MKTPAVMLVRLTAAVFILYGLGFVLWPSVMAEWVMGQAPNTAIALTDMRATYGGLSVGVGLVLWLLSVSPTGLVATASILLGMAGGRLLGMLQDGPQQGVMLVYLLVEIIVSAVALLLYRKQQ